MASRLTASVGRGGKNQPDDVKTVQDLINAFTGKLGFSKFKPDGKTSSNLEKAIGKFQEEYCKTRADYRVDPGRATFNALVAGLSRAEADRKAEAQKIVKMIEEQQKKVLALVRQQAEQEAKAKGFDTAGLKALFSQAEKYATDQWAATFGKDPKSAPSDPQQIVKNGERLAREARERIAKLSQEVEKTQPIKKTPLILTGSPTNISNGCFSFKVTGQSADKAARIYLVPGKFNLTLDMTAGYNKSMMPALFQLIDNGGLWGLNVPFFAVETTNGKVDMSTVSKPIVLRTPVAPFKGTVSLSGIGADNGMTYTGNGKGRYLHTSKINGWYFLRYGSDFERDPKMRGFDCITFVGSAMGKMSGMAGRGDGLAAELGATKVDLENVAKSAVTDYFAGDGKSGTFICWWATHCIAVKNGTVHEYSQSKGGYNTKSAVSYGWPSTGNYVRKL